jgi:hypothetical protein
MRVRTWDAKTLPFLEEKIAFRASALEGIELGSVLCLYGGNEGRLTQWYRKRAKKVLSVDIDGTADVAADAVEFLRSLPSSSWDCVDVDPFGSSMPAIQAFWEAGHRTRILLLTEGTMAAVRLRRRVNLFRLYGLPPNRPVHPQRWHYDYFESLVLMGVARVIPSGWSITHFSCCSNRYKMALYVAVYLEEGDA